MITNEREEILWKLRSLSASSFPDVAAAVFRYQSRQNPVYARFLALLNRSHTELADFPFLPIQVFKHHLVQTGDWQPERFFLSSGTTGQIPSRHAVRDTGFYVENALLGFAQTYGDPEDWCILALLPAYLEREGSSLVLMADAFIRRSRHPESGFFLHDHDRLATALQRCIAGGVPTLLLGVSFALLDFAEAHPMPLPGVVIMETGGMKGRRQEVTREALHGVLQVAFQTKHIHSEYGMTELFSQAYSQGGGLFTPSATMRILARDVYDPFSPARPGKTGVLNIIDLANLDTCSFIGTEDLGRVYADGRFEVLGRLDAAEVRGCNLMVEW